MARKLNTWVHVGENRYGPDDTVPDEVAELITNPDVWADDDTARDAPPVDNLVQAQVSRPPTSGAGSGREAWAEYARASGVEVTDDMDRSSIIAAVDRV